MKNDSKTRALCRGLATLNKEKIMTRDEFFERNKDLLESVPEYCEKCAGEIRLVCKDVCSSLPHQEGQVYEDMICDCDLVHDDEELCRIRRDNLRIN